MQQASFQSQASEGALVIFHGLEDRWNGGGSIFCASLFRMFLSAPCVCSRGVLLCAPLVVGPVGKSSTFAELFDKHVAGNVGASVSSERVTACRIDGRDANSGRDIDNWTATTVSFVKLFDCTSVQFTMCSDRRTSSGSIFDTMMAASRASFGKTSLPSKYKCGERPSLPADERLYNDLIDELDRRDIRWTKSAVESGHRFVYVLSKCLFNVDLYRSRFDEQYTVIPPVFDKFKGYNNPATSKHTPPPLDVVKLNNHVGRLSGVLMLPFLEQTYYRQLRDWGTELCEAMQKMVVQLSSQSVRSAENRESSKASRDPGQDDVCTTMQNTASDKHGDAYKSFSATLETIDVYEAVDFCDFAPTDRHKRRHWSDGIQATSPYAVYRFYPGGSISAMVVVWRLPDKDQDESLHAQGARVPAILSVSSRC